MAVGIGQGEVDELDMLPIAGEHDVGRLQVAMGDGRGMHVGKCLEEFVDDVLARVGISHSALLQGLTQRFAINIFKHDALAHGDAPAFTVDIVVEMLQPQAANDVGVVEQHEHFHLFEQHLPMGHATTQLGQECLQHVPSPEPLGTIELVRGGLAEQRHLGKTAVQLLCRI